MRKNARLRLHMIYPMDDFMIPKNQRPLVWKPSKKQGSKKKVNRRKSA
jgi:hypothetical protein